MFLFANLPLMVLLYSCFTAVMVVRTWLGGFGRDAKIGISGSYALVLASQIVFCALIVFGAAASGFIHYLGKLFAVLLTLFPLAVEQFVTGNRHAEFFPPTIEEISAISFSQIRSNMERISGILQNISSTTKSVSPRNLKTAFAELQGHSSTQYINDGTLTDTYFDRAYGTLEDLRLYIVISNTGSAASEIISVFTQKQYNHASISFDEGLDTIISYNGGVNVYPPGMNPEMLEMFHQKEDASVLVYSLPVTCEQKRLIIDKIAEINREGSAYNLMGLVLRRSYKPNIMFCSQFVYKMLKLAGVHYFNKKEGKVRPTDLIELDYYKKLAFEYEIKF
jgi:hypothetical protein